MSTNNPKKEAKVKICMIVAMSKRGRVIGGLNGGDHGMPWKKIPEDLGRFKQITMGHPVIMGRKTWESFGRRGLRGRLNIVVSSRPDYPLPANTKPDDPIVILHNSPRRALWSAIASEERRVGGPEEKMVFIIGGGEMYRYLLYEVDRLYLTLIDIDLDSSAPEVVTFPEYENRFKWVVSREESADDNYRYEFQILERCQ